MPDITMCQQENCEKKLEDIGFYTLEDNRVKNTCITSPLWRNELILTSRCNFNCPYCRGIKTDYSSDLPLDQVKNIINFWAKENIQNIRFSGGEPTVYPYLKEVIKYTKDKCKNIKHIAVSTNGYADIEYYIELINLGVNDFSISLDACCASTGDMMTGGIKGAWQKVVDNIKEIAKLTYVTVGVVLTDDNINELSETIEFAHNLGVADIRIISSAQWNNIGRFKDIKVKQEILDAHPILKYRINHFNIGRNVRGITEIDFHKCALVLDDMVVKENYHYPCIIKMREGCEPIGALNGNVRQDRYNYFKNHNSYTDPICQKNCLDVCIDYNNKYCKYQIDKTFLPKIDSSQFTWSKWESGSIHNFNLPCRFPSITSLEGINILRKYAIGWNYGEKIVCRPKENHIALMCFKDDEKFWFHLRNKEFYEVFIDYKNK